MGAKGDVLPGMAGTNHFRLELVGLVPIPVVRVGALMREVVMAEMPDQTWQTTGQVKPGESDFDVPAHHDTAIAALGGLLTAAATGTLLAKTAATLFMLGADNTTVKRAILIDGFQLSKLETPELQAGEDGELAVFKYTFKYDNITVLP